MTSLAAILVDIMTARSQCRAERCPVTIVSGGQTGVDRGALDAAMALGAHCGGWCPQGRLAEDGIIDARYPLRQLPGGGYLERTRRNVLDSDGTLAVTYGPASGGTAATIECCREFGRPLLVVDATVTDPTTAAGQVAGFLDRESIRRLNVAGPRASGEPGAYAYAYALVCAVLELRDREGR